LLFVLRYNAPSPSLASGFRNGGIHAPQSCVGALRASRFAVALHFTHFAGIAGSGDASLLIHLRHCVYRSEHVVRRLETAFDELNAENFPLVQLF